MSVVDDQGRLFGRWNVVDALLGVVLLVMIPLLYGAYVLFRPVTPSLTSIEPARIFENTPVDFVVHGNNLRPYMRISFNDQQGIEFFFADATKANVPARPLQAGVYDVILYDHAQERARIPRGLEVLPAPVPHTQLDLIGSFTTVMDAAVPQLKAGAKIDNLGEIVRVGSRQPSITRTVLGGNMTLDVPSGNAFNVPAIVRATCALMPRNGAVSCVAADANLIEEGVVNTIVAGTKYLFQIDQIRVPTAPESVTVRVRFAGDRAALELMRTGDRDVRHHNEFATAGEILSLDSIRQSSTSVGIVIPVAPGMMQPFVATDLAFREATLRVDAQLTNDQWSYAGRNISIGGLLTFTGPSYDLRGTVVSISRSAKP